MFRLLITGSRSWNDIDAIKREFDVVAQHEGANVTLVSGTAGGADSMCEYVASLLGWVIERHPADWNTHGKKAGFVRNREMVELGADFCLAFIKDDSAGASMTARIAKEAKIPTKQVKVSSWVTDYVKEGE
jgi:hypothetical protein